MIIWLNGPFGAGKTTLAEKLRERRPGSLLFDPEEIGFVVKTMVPPADSGDYQDLPIWRRLTVATLLEVRSVYPQDIIVPMTLVQPDYLEEILGRLRRQEEEVMHVSLTLDERLLRARIAEQTMSPEPTRDHDIREWRLAQVERCLSARHKMPRGTRFLDSGIESPDSLADIVVEWLAGCADEPTKSSQELASLRLPR
jgi:AAA domain